MDMSPGGTVKRILPQVKKCLKRRERMLKARSRSTSLQTLEQALAFMKLTSQAF